MIHRAEHTNGFVGLTNDTARNLELSDGAFRLLVFMLSMTDDWNFSIKGLTFQTGWPERKVMRLVAELKKAGHIVQKLQLDERGKFLPSVWDVYEVPINAIRVSRKAVPTQSVNDAKREPRNASPTQRVKSVVIRKPIYKEDQYIKKTNGEKKDEFEELLKPLRPDIKETFQEFIKMRKTIKAPMTVKALDLAIKKAEKLGGGDPDKMKAVIEQSILNSWKGLFALKEPERPKPAPIKSTGNEFLDLLKEWGESE